MGGIACLSKEAVLAQVKWLAVGATAAALPYFRHMGSHMHVRVHTHVYAHTLASSMEPLGLRKTAFLICSVDQESFTCLLHRPI